MDISKQGMMLLNNLFGLIPCGMLLLVYHVYAHAPCICTCTMYMHMHHVYADGPCICTCTMCLHTHHVYALAPGVWRVKCACVNSFLS